MKESDYKSFDELPLFLNADTVAKVLGVSPSSGYELMQEAGVPLSEDRQPYRDPQGGVHTLGGRSHRWRIVNKYYPYPKRNLVKNYSPMPNEGYYLSLSYGAIAVYGYLLHIEDRKTYPAIAPSAGP